MAALTTTHDNVQPESREGDHGRNHACTFLQKQDKQRAAEFVREAEKNRRLIEKLEKDRTLSVQCRKNSWTDVYEELEEYEKQLEEERKAEKMNLQKQMGKIQNGVRKFQRHLTDVKPTSELIKGLKDIMSEVEIAIHTLKEEQHLCFEAFTREERACQQEVSAYEKKIKNWSFSVKANQKVPTIPTRKTKAPDRNLPAEVKALDAFLQKTGGVSGGWDQCDHQAFLKVWMKHHGNSSYIKEAKLYLPEKTQEEIQQHEKWHQELMSLQDKQREAIERWKNQKKHQLQSRMLKQKEVEEAEMRKESQRFTNRKLGSEKERRELAQQLEAWREKKKRKEEEDEEQKVFAEIQKRRREKEERRQQVEVKLAIEEQLRLRRGEEEERERKKTEKEQKEQEARRKEAAKSIRRFSERDLHKVEAKVHEKLQKEKEDEERRRRIADNLREKVNIHVSKDPSRLTTPTKGWQERMKHIGPSGSGPASHMFHRAVPTWRQGL